MVLDAIEHLLLALVEEGIRFIKVDIHHGLKFFDGMKADGFIISYR